MLHNKIVAGITQGDINGISYEVIMKTLSDPRINEFCIPVVYGSPKVAAYHRKAVNLTNFSFHHIHAASEANPKKANIINCVSDDIRVELGKSTAMAGEASVVSLERAVQDLKTGRVDVLVTGPINKHNVYSESFPFPGHTEFFEHTFGKEGESLMFLIGEQLRVGLVTGHIPLAEVPQTVTQERVREKARIMEASLRRDFNIRKPRIAVLGVNPHAGDDGLLGHEEIDQVIPAIKELYEKEDLLVFGPYPADGFFGSGEFKKFDGVLAMYHDQGLSSFKALNFHKGVNFTAGLPFVRTSPGHGTAYDLAGAGKASPESFREALFMAIDIFRNRQSYDEITQNPLPSYNKQHNGDQGDS
ncbi:MAG: 4-hydroxythreonine-4-phosphate dehydrogenase PdxA [Chlorobi bacterium]|nr:4-hydroxythreonine-4-phosphate dehydrogenase PdxA [Chlorobiota bacterium]